MRGLSAKLTGGENNAKMLEILQKNYKILNIFSPSVAFGDSSLIRGSLRNYYTKRFLDSLIKRCKISISFSICSYSGFFHLGRVRRVTRSCWKKSDSKAALCASIKPYSILG